MKWKKNIYLYLTFIIAFGFFCSCEKETIKPLKVETVSFKKDIVPIFTNKCAQCHSGSRLPNLSSADAAYNTLKSGGYYNISNPSQSKIYTQLTTNPTHIPNASDFEKQEILLWITLGAKND